MLNVVYVPASFVLEIPALWSDLEVWLKKEV